MDLRELIEDYGTGLTTYCYNQYVRKLRVYLVEYVDTVYPHIDTSNLLTHDFSRQDIIKSTLYYVQNNKGVNRISSIDDFLTALNRFFEDYWFTRFHNQNLKNLTPFTSLADEIKQKALSAGVDLLDKESFPPIDDIQHKYVIAYFEEQEKNRLQSFQTPIIAKLMMIYGFSFDKLAKLKYTDYIPETHQLLVDNTREAKHRFCLDLPKGLGKDFTELLCFRNGNNKIQSSLLFTTERGKRIEHSVMKEKLDSIRAIFEEKNKINFDNTRNPFTSTGLQKYAIKKMILAKMNHYIIMELTGQLDTILEDCQLSIDEDESTYLDRNSTTNDYVANIELF